MMLLAWLFAYGLAFGEATRPTLVIGIGGASGAGKTELADRIARLVDSEDVVVLSMDSYFRDLAELPKDHYVGGEPNGDHPSALDFERLIADVGDLARGHSVNIPEYDFLTDRSRPHGPRIGPARVVIVEGFHAFWHPRLRKMFDWGLFVTADADLRLGRRLKRDVRQRNRTMEQSLDYWFKIVRPMQTEYVDPTILFADRRVEGDDLHATALEVSAEIVRSLSRLKDGRPAFFYDRELGVPKKDDAALRGESIRQVMLEQGSKAVLYVGGSLRPPTLDHVGLMIQSMTRFGFTRGFFLPSNSYKAGSINNAAALLLSRVQVEHFNEALDANGVAYSNFSHRPQSGARWQGPDGRDHRVQVDSTEIDIANPVVDGEDRRSLLAFERLVVKAGGDPRSVFWIAGGDSFNAMPRWNSRGVEHLDHAHWIVVTRPELEGRENNVSFEAHDPVRAVLGEEIVEKYTYYYDHSTETHVYENKDPKRPNIYVIRLAKNGVISSTSVRASLSGATDHVVARAGTTPSVYRTCLERGFFKEATGCSAGLETTTGGTTCAR